jgi:hypothetical protein
VLTIQDAIATAKGIQVVSIETGQAGRGIAVKTVLRTPKALLILEVEVELAI